MLALTLGSTSPALRARAADAPALGLRFDASDVYVAQGQSVAVRARVSNLTAGTLALVGASTDAGSPVVAVTCFDAFLAAAPAQLGPYEAWEGDVIQLTAPAGADTGLVVLGVRIAANDPADDTTQLGISWVRVHITPPGCGPLVSLPPRGAAVATGRPVELIVQVSSASEPQYQWRREGVALNDGGEVSGSTSEHLVIGEMSAALDGVYDCVITNDCGSVTSAGARLSTCSQPSFGVRADFTTAAAGAVLVRRDTDPGPHLVTLDGSGMLLDHPLDASGALSGPAPLATRPAPTQLLSADLNRDDVPDLVTLSPADHSFSVFLAAPGAGYLPRIDGAIAGIAGRIAIGDMDGDGIPDMAVSYPATYTMDVRAGVGDGTFVAVNTMDVDPASDMRVVDLDGDGRGEIVLVSDATNRVSVLGSSTGFDFGQPARLSTLPGPLGLEVADLDRDGRADLVVTQEGGHAVSRFMALAGGGFDDRDDFAVIPAPRSPHVLDLDGDGLLDLVVADHASAVLVRFAGEAGGVLGAGTPHGVGEGPAVALGGDADGDGLADLIAVHDTPAGATLLYQRCDSPATTGVGGELGGRLALAPVPNPFRDDMRLTLTMPRTGHVELGVYDASGRLVRHLQRGTLGAGLWRFAWDGRDARQAPVHAGVYFVRARVDGTVIRSKVVRIP